MKIQQEHFERMQSAIAPLDTEELRQRCTDAGYSTTRYQWDLLRAARLLPFVVEVLYKYCDDNHIQTALNKIVKPLKIKRGDNFVRCWCCGKHGHTASNCKDSKAVNEKSVEQLIAEGFVCLEGGGLVHPDYLKE